MKNKIKILFLSLLSVALLLFAVSCGSADSGEGGDSGNNNGEHVKDEDHEWNPVDKVAPTCTAEGKAIYECSCGEKKEEAVAALGHEKNTLTRSDAPTCTDEGANYYSCTRCTDEIKEVVSALGHTETAMENVAADCGNDGSEGGIYCSVCEEVIKEPTVVPSNGNHTPVNYENVDPTCGSVGYSGGSYCSVCEKVLTERTELPANGTHTPEDVAATNASCYATGNTAGKRCSVCKTVISGMLETPKLPHSYNQTLTKAPSASEDGELTYVCAYADCKHTYTEVIPKLDYDSTIVWDGSVASGFASGSGTQKDPYIIATAAQFAYFVNEGHMTGNKFEGMYIELATDVVLNDLSNYANWGKSAPANVWTPMFSSGFYGHFDGKGHTIRGIYSTGKYAGGLFGLLCAGSISNVSVSEVYINYTGSDAVGGIVSKINVSANSAAVIGCSFSGTIRAKAVGGGVIGGAQLGSHSNLSVSNRADYYGGLVVEDCSASGKIMTNSTSYNEYDCVGGIIGKIYYDYTDLTIKNCTNNAYVESYGQAAGIVGYVAAPDTPFITNIIFDGLVNRGTVVTYGNGAAGIAAVLSLSWDYNSRSSNTLTIRNCANEGSIVARTSKNAYVGGLFAELRASSSNASRCTQYAGLLNCYNTGDVSYIGSATDAAVGGIVANLTFEAVTSEFYNNFNSGNVSASNSYYAGGLAGYIGYNNTYVVKIDSCYNDGNVITNGAQVGGIAGYFGSGNVTNVYNAGTIYGKNKVGGIFGSFTSYYSKLNGCFNVGTVSGMEKYIGAIVGTDEDEAGDIQNAYYLVGTATDGKGYYQGVYGYDRNWTNTTASAEIKADKLSVSSSYVRFDFTGKWNAPDGSAGSYPTLKNVVKLPTEE